MQTQQDIRAEEAIRVKANPRNAPLSRALLLVSNEARLKTEKLFDNAYMIAKLEIPFSRAPAAQRAAKRSPIIIEKGTTRMHRNRNPCNSFLMVKMASGMDHGRVRPTTTTTTKDVAQHGGHPANTKSCSLGLQHISLILDMHIMCN